MPLTRIQLRNEFRLGDPELYRGAKRDDTKAILDSVAVAGLVGLLRQLGDLAQFAAEVFHDLQKQVTATAARSHKIMTRMQCVESALPSFEKTIMSQTSHIHFTYTAGSDWLADIQIKQNHVTCTDLPQFIMDSYEDCRDPPRLSSLDKFDAAGAGACLRRYSDPTFFKTAWTRSELAKTEKTRAERISKKNKNNVPRQRGGESQHAASISRCYIRLRFASPGTVGQTDAVSTSNMRFTSRLANQSESFNSEIRPDYCEHVLDVNSSMGSDEVDSRKSSASNLKTSYLDSRDPTLPNEQSEEGTDDHSPYKSLPEYTTTYVSSSVIWDEKTDIVKLVSVPSETISEVQYQSLESLPASTAQSKLDEVAVSLANVPKTVPRVNQFEEVIREPDNYVDAHNTIESENETDSECQTKRELELQSEFRYEGVEPVTGGLHVVAAQKSDSSSVDSPVAFCSSSNKDFHPNSTCSFSLENSIHAQPPQVSRMASDPEWSINLAVCDAVSRLNSSNKDLPPNSTCSTTSENVTLAQPPEVNGMASELDCSVNSTVCENVSRSNYSRKELPPNSTCSTSSDSLTDAQLPQWNSIASDLDCHIKSSVCEDVSRLDVCESLNGDLPSESIISSSDEKKVMVVSCKSADSPKFSVVPSINIWTNGCLLGLEPSKPPDFVVSNDVSQDFIPITSSCRDDLSCQTVVPELHRDVYIGESLTLVAPIEQQEQNSSSLGDQQVSSDIVRFTDLHNPPLGHLVVRKGNSDMESVSAIFGHTNGADLPLVSNTLVQPSESSQNSDKMSSGVSDIMHQNLTSSPPLEHMKISFHPINGMQTSKLKLEFPYEHHFHESVQDSTFPSFQLPPEPSIQMLDMGSESDDDTFYRSSPYPSDDLLSLCSESNSEQWESAEITGRKDGDLYDALIRDPSTATISCYSELEGMNRQNINPANELASMNAENGIEPLEYCSSIDLPSPVVLSSLTDSQQRGKGNSELKGLQDYVLQYPNELLQPPPLPPLKWRMTEPTFPSSANKQQSTDEDDTQTLQVEKHDSPQQKPLPPINSCSSEGDCQRNGQHVQTLVTSLPSEQVQPKKPHDVEAISSPDESKAFDGGNNENQSHG